MVMEAVEVEAWVAEWAEATEAVEEKVEGKGSTDKIAKLQKNSTNSVVE